MPFTLVDLLLGFVTPLAIAWAACHFSTLALGASDRFVSRVAFPVALLAGVSIGYYSLGLGPFVPRFDRDWIVASAWLALPASAYLSSRSPKYWFAFAAVVIGGSVAAFLLVPTWESLQPELAQYRVGLASGCLGLCTVSVLAAIKVDRPAGSRKNHEDQPTADRDYAHWKSTASWCCCLQMFLFCVALMALSGSLGFATIAIALVGAGLGLALAAWTRRSDARTFQTAPLVPVWTFLVAGLSFTAYVNSSTSIPLFSYALLPFAPALGAQVFPRTDKPTRRRHLVAAFFVTGCVCALAIGVAVAAQWDSLTAQEAY